MMHDSQYLQHRELRAPRESGTALVDPPFDEVGGVLAANRTLRSDYCYDFHGRCLSRLAVEARKETLAEARAWTASYRDVDAAPIDPAAPLLMAGHQPQLFHPGVWFKNLALDRLAREHRAVGVNLVVDNDTLKTAWLRVPGGSADRPQLAAMAMDQSGPQVPYEERAILDREMFAYFGRRVARQIEPLVGHPMIGDFWPMVVARMKATGNLGECLAEARHQWEGRWGASTLEVPLSRLCRTGSFRWFLAHLLVELPRLREVYNRVVGEYRRVHGIRSTAHPMPDLAQQGDWLEAPFWIWTREDPRRRHLFARGDPQGIVLSDRRGLEATLPLVPDGDLERAVQRLDELERQGIKIRSRALITTLWSRLVVGDLFLHGIGGAKYDQVTDALLAGFFGLEPARFLVLSATLHLPIPHPSTTADDLRLVEHRLRELDWHPELYLEPFVGGQPPPEELVAAKRAWINTPRTSENVGRRYHEFRRLNEALQPYVESNRRRLLEERERVGQSLRSESILSSREYAFCLFPEDELRNFFSRLLPKNG